MVTKASTNNNGLSFNLAPADKELLEDYFKNDLIIPGRINEDNHDFAPLDFTSLSSKEIGRQQSAWSVRHAYLLYLLGNLEAEKGNLRADLKEHESAWMVRNLGDFKLKWEAEYSMGEDKEVRRLRRRLARVEASLSRFQNLAEAYRVIRDSASREISRRIAERSSRD